jgi:DeoR/GlpR family transcriptional regulator of sugar metabolism
MYQFERKEKILERLHSSGQITIAEDAKDFEVSISTLHRDLEELEQEGIVKKVRGGAILVEAAKFETHFEKRMRANVELKEQIARNAVQTIHDDTSIFLDHSSTVAMLAREIGKQHFRNLIILTNSLSIPEIIAEDNGVHVIVTGGLAQSGWHALSGPWVMDAIQRLNVHQFFISVGAVSPEKGLMTASFFIHEIMREIIRYATAVNILVDSTKFHKIGTFQIAPLDESMLIFTNQKAPKEIIKEIEERGPKVVM